MQDYLCTITVCVVLASLTPPTSCAVTIHKTCTDQQRAKVNVLCWQHTKHIDQSKKPKSLPKLLGEESSNFESYKQQCYVFLIYQQTIFLFINSFYKQMLTRYQAIQSNTCSNTSIDKCWLCDTIINVLLPSYSHVLM